MSGNNKYFTDILKQKFPDIFQEVKDKKYILLIPKENLIISNTLILTKQLYYNHVYYKDEYNDNLYINLNGKVLKYEHPKFITYLGWSKDMVFKILDNFNFEDNIPSYVIDNICHDEHYSFEKQKSNDNQFKRCPSQKEYLEYYNNFHTMYGKKYTNFIERLTKFTNEMKYNYILLKGEEDSYSKIFVRRVGKLIYRISQIFSDFNNTKKFIDIEIFSELVDSLIFNEIYDFLFNKLELFFQEEENMLQNNLNTFSQKYELQNLKVDEAFYNCKFLNAIQKLEELSKYSTIFEKINVLAEVNKLIIEEAKSSYESKNKGSYIPKTDELVAFLTYVVSHCRTKNIVAESKFLELFWENGKGEMDFLKTNFNMIVNTNVQELGKEKECFNQHIESNIIIFDNSPE